MEEVRTTEAQSVRGKGWVKFDEDGDQNSEQANSETPGSIEVKLFA